jgi:hypothetical protein
MKVEKTFWVEYESFKQFKKALSEGGKVDLKISTTPDSGNDYMETLTIAYEIDREIILNENEATRILKEEIVSQTTVDNIIQKLFGDK